jgi:bifunctional non-homologous end joining protein LigD
MLATLGELPRDPGHWAFEVKWDGVRALAIVRGGTVELRSRTGGRMTDWFPELHGLGVAIAPHAAVLDGEVVAFDDAGLPSFAAIQPRLGRMGAPRPSRRICFMAFDVLEVDGRDLRREPWTERRRVLEALLEDGEAWRVPAAHVGDDAGEQLLASVHQLGMEGVVAKRLDSTYASGRRTGAWRKVKLHRSDEFVVWGFTEGAGSRASSIGSLLIATVAPDGSLRQAGAVGTGWTQAQGEALRARLQGTEVEEPALDAELPAPIRRERRAVHYVAPELVCEVAFGERTDTGSLRHPRLRGVRFDKTVADLRADAS